MAFFTNLSHTWRIQHRTVVYWFWIKPTYTARREYRGWSYEDHYDPYMCVDVRDHSWQRGKKMLIKSGSYLTCLCVCAVNFSFDVRGIMQIGQVLVVPPPPPPSDYGFRYDSNRILVLFSPFSSCSSSYIEIGWLTIACVGNAVAKLLVWFVFEVLKFCLYFERVIGFGYA